ncbi:MAG: cytochrome c [Arenicellales bacterium]|nr:cytochrome c [Arenicellales bacterium]
MFLILIVLLSLPVMDVVADSSIPTAKRQGELLHLLRHDCGSCHGMTLQGGLGPALTQEALAGKPMEYLYLTVRDGHPDTPMPPWRGLLDDTEIRWLVTQLMQGVQNP